MVPPKIIACYNAQMYSGYVVDAKYVIYQASTSEAASTTKAKEKIIRNLRNQTTEQTIHSSKNM